MWVLNSLINISAHVIPIENRVVSDNLDDSPDYSYPIPSYESTVDLLDLGSH